MENLGEPFIIGFFPLTPLAIIREVVMRKLGIPIPEPVVPSEPPTTEA